MSVVSAIQRIATEGTISLKHAIKLAAEYGLPLAEVEKRALSIEIWPLRYLRNSPLLSPNEQIKLLESTVLVAGCGGLGSHVAMHLARLGTGRLILVDPDRFEESNLNKQLFCTVKTIGMFKAEVAARKIGDINPAVSVTAINDKVENTRNAINRASTVIDCLDNIPSRLTLADISRTAGVPLIHGAVSGLAGEIAVEMPGGKTVMERLYPNPAARQRSPAVPGFSAGAVAALQCAEAWKILTGRKALPSGNRIFWEIDDFSFDEG